MLLKIDKETKRMLQIDIWDEIPEDELEVGMYVGVCQYDKQHGKLPLVEMGEIISIEARFVRLRHNSKTVTDYEIGNYKFLEHLN